MPGSILPDRRYSAKQVAAAMAHLSGRPVDARTVWRWMRAGIRGVRLASEKIGGRRFVSGMALLAFHRAIQPESQDSELAAQAADALNLSMRRAAAREVLRSRYGFTCGD